MSPYLTLTGRCYGGRRRGRPDPRSHSQPPTDPTTRLRLGPLGTLPRMPKESGRSGSCPGDPLPRLQSGGVGDQPDPVSRSSSALALRGRLYLVSIRLRLDGGRHRLTFTHTCVAWGRGRGVGREGGGASRAKENSSTRGSCTEDRVTFVTREPLESPEDPEGVPDLQYPGLNSERFKGWVVPTRRSPLTSPTGRGTESRPVPSRFSLTDESRCCEVKGWRVSGMVEGRPGPKDGQNPRVFRQGLRTLVHGPC